MTIKEVEKLLNISRANVRYYEKQGLLLPTRSNNSYREYNEEDIKTLKQIIIFRKCNISIENIKKIFDKEKSLEEISKEQLTEIERTINELNGAKKICKMISKEQNNITNFDENKYLEIISSEEKNGNVFNNFAEDFWCSEENMRNDDGQRKPRRRQTLFYRCRVCGYPKHTRLLCHGRKSRTYYQTLQPSITTMGKNIKIG